MAHTGPKTPDEKAAARVHHVIQLLNRAVYDARALGLEVRIEEVPAAQNPKASTATLFRATVKRVTVL